MIKKWIIISISFLICFALIEFVVIPIRDNEIKKELQYQKYEHENSLENIKKTITDNLITFQNAADYLESEENDIEFNRMANSEPSTVYVWNNGQSKAMNISEIDKNIAFILTDLNFEFVSMNESYVEFRRTGFSSEGTYFITIEYYKNSTPDNTRHKIIDHWYYSKIYGT